MGNGETGIDIRSNTVLFQAVSTPWIELLTSRAVWACWFGHFAGTVDGRIDRQLKIDIE